MKIIQCRDVFAEVLSRTRSAASPGTPLGGEACAVMEMAQAYQRDGATFYHKGDLVNALAAFFYGAGWLHFGISSGLLTCDDPKPFCPFAGPSERLPLPLSEKLEEKTHRYERLLDTAISSVECTGEQGTISKGFSEKVLFIAHIYATQGARSLENGAYEGALAGFSYGHGWLDAGVTGGYFRIMAHRDIFTV
jgi:uncharacterized protein